MWGEPVSFVAGKLHGWEGLDGQAAKMSKSRRTDLIDAVIDAWPEKKERELSVDVLS